MGETWTATPVQECYFPGWSRPRLHYSARFHSGTRRWCIPGEVSLGVSRGAKASLDPGGLPTTQDDDQMNGTRSPILQVPNRSISTGLSPLPDLYGPRGHRRRAGSGRAAAALNTTDGLVEGSSQGVLCSPAPPRGAGSSLAHLEHAAGRLNPAPDGPPRNECGHEGRNPPASAPPAFDAPPDHRQDLDLNGDPGRRPRRRSPPWPSFSSKGCCGRSA